MAKARCRRAASAYRWWFAAHSIRALKRNVLQFVGIAPVRATIVGAVGQLSPQRAQHWLERTRRLGREAH